MSAVHCVGMCGGIIGALTFSLPESVRGNRRRLFPYVAAYNLGRITSYTVAGALAGAIGGSVFAVSGFPAGYIALQGLAALMLAGMALHLSGWLPRFALIERIGVPLWRALEPLGRRLLPARSPLHAWLFGLVWGWLPCGLVYSVLVWTTTAGSAAKGAGYMLAFGVGTLPSVMGGGLFAAWLVNLSRRRPWLRQLVGALILIMALVGLYVNLQHGGATGDPHSGHMM